MRVLVGLYIEERTKGEYCEFWCCGGYVLTGLCFVYIAGNVVGMRQLDLVPKIFLKNIYHIVIILCLNFTLVIIQNFIKTLFSRCFEIY